MNSDQLKGEVKKWSLTFKRKEMEDNFQRQEMLQLSNAHLVFANFLWVYSAFVILYQLLFKSYLKLPYQFYAYYGIGIGIGILYVIANKFIASYYKLWHWIFAWVVTLNVAWGIYDPVFQKFDNKKSFSFGIYQGTVIMCYLDGGNFIPKSLLLSSVSICLIGSDLVSSNNLNYLTILRALLPLILCIMKIRHSEIMRREIFLEKSKLEEIMGIIQKQIPLPVFIAKFNKKQNAMNFLFGNLQAERKLGIFNQSTYESFMDTCFLVKPVEQSTQQQQSNHLDTKDSSERLQNNNLKFMNENCFNKNDSNYQTVSYQSRNSLRCLIRNKVEFLNQKNKRTNHQSKFRETNAFALKGHFNSLKRQQKQNSYQTSRSHGSLSFTMPSSSLNPTIKMPFAINQSQKIPNQKSVNTKTIPEIIVQQSKDPLIKQSYNQQQFNSKLHAQGELKNLYNESTQFVFDKNTFIINNQNEKKTNQLDLNQQNQEQIQLLSEQEQKFKNHPRSNSLHPPNLPSQFEQIVNSPKAVSIINAQNQLSYQQQLQLTTILPQQIASSVSFLNIDQNTFSQNLINKQHNSGSHSQISFLNPIVRNKRHLLKKHLEFIDDENVLVEQATADNPQQVPLRYQIRHRLFCTNEIYAVMVVEKESYKKKYKNEKLKNQLLSEIRSSQHVLIQKSLKEVNIILKYLSQYSFDQQQNLSSSDQHSQQLTHLLASLLSMNLLHHTFAMFNHYIGKSEQVMYCPPTQISQINITSLLSSISSSLGCEFRNLLKIQLLTQENVIVNSNVFLLKILFFSFLRYFVQNSESQQSHILIKIEQDQQQENDNLTATSNYEQIIEGISSQNKNQRKILESVLISIQIPLNEKLTKILEPRELFIFSFDQLLKDQLSGDPLRQSSWILRTACQIISQLGPFTKLFVTKDIQHEFMKISFLICKNLNILTNFGDASYDQNGQYSVPQNTTFDKKKDDFTTQRPFINPCVREPSLQF